MRGHKPTDQKKSSVKFPEANPNPVLSTGLDGVLLYVNPAALQLCHDVTEYRPEAVLGRLNDILTRLYGLTRAEARLTEQLVNGTSLKQASEDLGIAISTARSQLKCVFRKTGTARQSELIRCILMGPTA